MDMRGDAGDRWEGGKLSKQTKAGASHPCRTLGLHRAIGLWVFLMEGRRAPHFSNLKAALALPWHLGGAGDQARLGGR